MDSPRTPLDANRLAEALKAEGFVRGMAHRYGRFNDVYWQQSAEALLARLQSTDPSLSPDQEER